MTPLDQRPRYEPGGISWARLPILALAPIAAIALAYALHFAFMHGFYILMIMPLFAGLILAGVMFGLVGAARLRQRWLAAVAGVATGVFAFLAYYQFGLNAIAPPGAEWRVDVLPDYIVARIRTDVWVDVGRGDPGVDKKPFVPMNIFMFATELFCIAAFPAGVGWTRAGRAYCPELGRWMSQEAAWLPPGLGPQLIEAAEAGTLREFVAATPARGHPQFGCVLTLEYAEGAYFSVLDHPVYATLNDAAPAGPKTKVPKRLKLLHQVALEPAEVVALRPLFPQLSRALGTQPEPIPEAPAPPPPAVVVEGELAEITPVPDPYGKRVRSRGYALKVNLLDLIPMLFIVAGLALAGLGAWLIGDVGMFVQGLAVVVLGVPPILWGIYTGLLCVSVGSNRWIERRLRHEIGQRPDPLVDPRDPDSLYVSLFPRESFAKVRWTFSSDLMLLKIDRAGRKLLMEGDADRYRIPAGSILGCESMGFGLPIDPQKLIWVVQLLVRTAAGPRELLVGVNHTTWTPSLNDTRRVVADNLCRRIYEMLRS